MITAGQQIAEQANANKNYDVFGSIVYNVKAYGAKGDSFTDDTQALVALINVVDDLGGGEIFFPAGTYNIASFVNVPEEIVLISNGTASIVGPIRAHKLEHITLNGVYMDDRDDIIYNATYIDNFKQYLTSLDSDVTNVALVGDSITYGQVSSDEQHRSWAGLLRRFLTERYGNAGFGYYFGGSGNTEYKEGTNLKTYKLNTGSVNFLVGTLRFKDLEVIKGKNTDGGTFNIAVDGVNYPVSSAGSSREYGVHETIYTSPEVTDHVVQVFKPASAVGYFEGLGLIDDTKGIRVHQIGHVGIKGSEYDATAAAATLTAIAPKLTVIGLGMNDFIAQSSVSAYKTGVETLIQQAVMNDGTVILINYQDTNDGASPITLSGHYRKAMLELAGQYNCVFIDIDKKWINNATKVANGFGVAFDPHPYDAGHQDIFGTFQELFADPKRPDRSFEPSFISSSGKSSNERNEAIVEAWKNVNYSKFALITNERFRIDAGPNGIADGFSIVAVGDNTGNSNTPTITASGQKISVSKVNVAFSAYRLSASFSGLTLGDEYLLFVKYVNCTPLSALELVDDFTNVLLLTDKTAVSNIVAVKRTVGKTNPTIYFNKSQTTVATHLMEFSGVGVYNLSQIRDEMGIDFTGYSAEDAAKIIDASLSRRLNGAPKITFVTDSVTGDTYAVTVESGAVTATLA